MEILRALKILYCNVSGLNDFLNEWFSCEGVLWELLQVLIINRPAGLFFTGICQFSCELLYLFNEVLLQL